MSLKRKQPCEADFELAEEDLAFQSRQLVYLSEAKWSCGHNGDPYPNDTTWASVGLSKINDILVTEFQGRGRMKMRRTNGQAVSAIVRAVASQKQYRGTACGGSGRAHSQLPQGLDQHVRSTAPLQADQHQQSQQPGSAPQPRLQVQPPALPHIQLRQHDHDTVQTIQPPLLLHTPSLAGGGQQRLLSPFRIQDPSPSAHTPTFVPSTSPQSISRPSTGHSDNYVATSPSLSDRSQIRTTPSRPTALHRLTVGDARAAGTTSAGVRGQSTSQREVVMLQSENNIDEEAERKKLPGSRRRVE
ncbi:hypothetical protein BT69DRAFT_1292955 [Atractiella rhizophila]|nr:hypothetical protein BT69DRAFT_1292955 [Atractiella rhizophila]